jgi:O-antigen/teichoic acid export membrane protein
LFLNFSSRLSASILKSAWPIAVVGALGFFLTNTDILIISWMRTASDVGIYSAAIRIIQTLYLVPAIIQLSTLPVFSRLARNHSAEENGAGQARFRAALERTVSILFLFSIPMAAGGVLLGTEIMSFLFGGAYAPGGLSLTILMAGLTVDFSAAVISNAIFAYGRQKSLIVASAIAGATNVAFDLLFIPRWGITGSAVATLIAQICTNGYLWHTMRRINYFSIFPYVGKVVAATVAMSFGILAMKILGVQVLVNILISTAIYFATLIVMKESLVAELATLFKLDKLMAMRKSEQ